MMAQRLPVGSAARRDRAIRILDTAAELLLQHGYRRVSIDDVARAAGIGKGTVYLHWKTREALFWAVLLRESEQMLSRLAADLRAAPELALPGPLMRAIFLEASRRPLVRALLLSDAEMLGRLTEDESVAAAQQELAGNADYLVMLADQGLLRPGLTPQTAGHILQSVMRGFFTTEGNASSGDATSGDATSGDATSGDAASGGAASSGDAAEGDRLSVEEQADLVAEVIERSLQTDGRPSRKAVTALAAAVIDLFTTITEVQRSQLERAY